MQIHSSITKDKKAVPLARNPPNSKDWISRFEQTHEIRGEFFEVLSSRSDKCFLLYENGKLIIERQNRIIAEDLCIESVQGVDNIHFVCGRYFKSDEPLPRAFPRIFRSKTRQTISWLEEFSPGKAIILSPVLLGFVFLYRAIFFTVGETIALVFPDHWERKIGENSYQGLSRVALSESSLTTRRQDHLRNRAKEMAEGAKLARRPRIFFTTPICWARMPLPFPGDPLS
uniref:Uncharacterized protein n=1 Tax=Candidatus Kentrum sp. LFY TaxID=2126342 RepID=A0A450UKI6_9GAMM|nr:MAG: hypothetical protein BECKLFY1418B_GA0070995_104111 [Candidatus Kentron sp. LFY]